MEKPNRAERRKQKFGGGRATEHGGWPTHQPNPVFGDEPESAPPAPAPKPTGEVPATSDKPADDAAKG